MAPGDFHPGSSCGRDSRLVVTKSTTGTADDATKASWRVENIASEVAELSRQAHLQLEHPPARVVHLTHGQAEPVPEKPEPLTAGPGDQFFGALRLVAGGMGVVHG